MLQRIACGLVLAPALLASSPAVLAQPAGSSPDEPPRTSPEALADVLEDEQARQRLIEDLRAMAAERRGEEAPTDTAAAPSLPERVAADVQGAVEGMADRVVTAIRALAAITGEGAIAWDTVTAAAVNLGIGVLVTLAVYLLLRRLDRPLYARANAWVLAAPPETALLRRAGAALLAVLIDVLTIVAACAAGWAVALTLLGEAGAVDPRITLFLNAFAALEGIKAGLRALFATRDDGLRLLPIAAEDAAYWYAWLAHLVSFVGYGVLLVVPIVGDTIAPALGQVVYVLVVLVGFIYALAILLQNRLKVRRRLETIAETAKLQSARIAAAVLARVWHLAAIAYLAALTIVLLTRPERALPFMAGATLQMLAAIGIGVLVGAAIGRAISRGIHVPETTRTKFPELEARLNAFLPRGLQVIRFVILLLVIAVVLDAWQLFDLFGWLGSPTGREILASAVAIALIILVAAAAWVALATWIDYALSPQTGTGEPDARHRTLLMLFRNALAVVIVTVSAMILLSEVGVNIGPLLAGAGVLGLAIGFGAQKLVQDIIGGVFIQLENAINTGDWVTAGNISGTAERLSIRSVGLRDLEGTLHIVPFSSVDTVSNYMRDFAFHVGIYSVAYGEDTDEVIPHLLAAFRELMEDPEVEPLVLGDLEVAGVTRLGESGVDIRIRIMTRPGWQWMVGRAYNRLVKRHFDAAGIEIPFPHRTLYFGDDREATAPPAHRRMLEAARQHSGKGDAPVDPDEPGR
jgi:small conductance mechanosensitive channel